MSEAEGKIGVEVGFGVCGAARRLGGAPANRRSASLGQGGLGACQARRSRSAATSTHTSCPFAHDFCHGAVIHGSGYGHARRGGELFQDYIDDA